jgi:hypothetical protein
MALGVLIIKARLGLTDEELVEQIKENPYLHFFIGLKVFQDAAPFDPLMMVCFRRRLPEAVINDCNERVVRHGLAVIHSEAAEEPSDDQDGGSASGSHQQVQATIVESNQGFLLIDASCAPADIRHPTDLSLLNEAREVTETLIDAMHPQVREYFGPKPCTHRKKARHQFLAVAVAEGFCEAVEEAASHQQDPQSHQATACPFGAQLGQNRWPDCLCGSLLPAGRYWYRKLLVVSELVRQQRILYHSDSSSIPHRIVSLYQAHIRTIVHGKARCNVGFGAKISILVTCDGFTTWIGRVISPTTKEKT